ncbi:MAG: hypothetical protein K9N06_07945 [Candidatus Cloacimonetes bacterium]|nr:hypothetical protein [Candidatus Cloacimonadota bacterium]
MENVFALVSPHIDEKSIKSYLEEKGLGSVEIWSQDNIPPFINPLEAIIILLLSGGTELLVKRIVEKAFSNVYVNCVPVNNSLSAAAELKGYYSNNNEISITSFSEETFNLLFNIENIKSSINKSKLLIIGRPQEWLLTSENISAPAPFQSKLIPLNWREWQSTLSRMKQEEAIRESEYWDNRTDLGKISREVFFNSGLLYVTFKFLLELHGANMLGIRCGELQKFGAAVCLALDRLNEEGIITSCEGDIEAAFSMKILNSLTHTPCWMTNISHIDFNTGKLFLTHCTMPVDMYSINRNKQLSPESDYDFMEEFMKEKKSLDVTIFRLGKNLNFSILEGSMPQGIIGKFYHCRTTMEIQTENSLHDWFDDICGNHQIITYGKYAEQLRYFFSIL